MHGGDDGELPKHAEQDKDEVSRYIFDCTFAEIQENHKKTHAYLNTNQDHNCLIPLVQDVFDLINSDEVHKMLLMLELKTPNNQEVRKSYRVLETVELLHDAIQKSQVAKYCIAHSFDHEALRNIEKVNETFMSTCSRPEIKVETVYL